MIVLIILLVYNTKTIIIFLVYTTQVEKILAKTTLFVTISEK